MTVSSTSSRVVYAGNGSTVTFPFAFRVNQPADLVVVYSDVTGADFILSPSQYAASGFGQEAGGSVTYPLSGGPIATGTRLTLYRDVAATQPTSLSNQGALWPQVIEAALDRIVMVVQQFIDAVNRGLRIPSTDGITLAALPTAIQRAGLVLAFDGNGQPNLIPQAGVAGDASNQTVLATGSTTALSLAAWFATVVNVKAFGAKCDSNETGSTGTDDTAAINAALAELPAGGSLLIPGWSRISGPLLVTRSNITICGLTPWGSGIVTTSATADIFTCTSGLSNVVFRDLGVWSTVTKSAGIVFNCPMATRYKFVRVIAGDRTRAQSDGNRLFRIVEMAGCDNSTIDNCTFAGASQTGVRVWGVSDHSSELSFDNDTRISLCDIGVSFAGNFGGGYLENVKVDGCRKNVVIDQSVVMTANREFFLSASCNIDVCSDTGLEIGANGASYIEIDSAWISSAGQYGSPTGNQTNLYVNATNAALVLAMHHTRLYNATGDGAKLLAGNIQADGLQVTNNGAYGVDLGASVTEYNAMGGRFGANNVLGDLRIDPGVVNYNIQGVEFISSIKLVNAPVLSSTQLIENCRGVPQEGTWTPVVAGSSTAGTQTYSVQTGRWRRSGNWITASFSITLASKDAGIAGNVQITGLPYAPLTGTNWAGSVGTVDRVAHASNQTQFAIRTPGDGSTKLQLMEMVDSGASNVSAFVPVSALNAITTIVGSVSYPMS
jgi:hypothetical protein